MHQTDQNFCDLLLITPNPEELISVHLVLRSSLGEDLFEQLLQDIEIEVTAHASSAAPPPRLQHDGSDTGHEKPLKVVLDSTLLSIRQTPKVLNPVVGENVTPCAVWQAELLLRYPVQKLHRPAIHFTASATLKAQQYVNTVDADSEYLPSAMPTSENLLQSLEHSPSFARTQLHLPASRLLKVAPRSSVSNADTKPLRASSKMFPIVPALMIRVHTSNRNPELLASLDLEVARYVDCIIQVQGISTLDSEVHGEPLDTSLQQAGSSISLHAGDRSVFLYKLLPRERDVINTAATGLEVLCFDIKANVRLSETCRPRLRAQWRGDINIQQGTVSGGLYHWQRPTSIMSPGANSLTAQRPASKHVSMSGRPVSTMRTDLGVTFAFTGPKSVVKGETFNLDVFAVNRSSRKKRLAIIAVPQSAKSALPQHGKLRLSMGNVEARKSDTQSADAVLDDRSTYALQNSRKGQIAEIVCLNADVRIG